MAKLKTESITPEDMLAYVEQSSDFGFELQILSNLIARGLDCEHSGTYIDPATQRPRQFDIRAQLTPVAAFKARLAIECKNLKENFPLLVYRMPRSHGESYVDVVHAQKAAQKHGVPFGLNNPSTVWRNQGMKWLYCKEDLVGKATTQVGRDLTGSLTGGDVEVYEKWNQAIHSAHDLVDRTTTDWTISPSTGCFTIVVPVLVVPNERLWSIDYSSDGTLIGGPTQEQRVPLFIGKHVWTGFPSRISVSFSHLEIVTEAGLEWLCDELRNLDRLLQKTWTSEIVRPELIPLDDNDDLDDEDEDYDEFDFFERDDEY